MSIVADETPEGIEISRITIVRRMTADDDLVEVETSGEIRFIEAMGMLVMAEQILNARNAEDDE